MSVKNKIVDDNFSGHTIKYNCDGDTVFEYNNPLTASTGIKMIGNTISLENDMITYVEQLCLDLDNDRIEKKLSKLNKDQLLSVLTQIELIRKITEKKLCEKI